MLTSAVQIRYKTGYKGPYVRMLFAKTPNLVDRSITSVFPIRCLTTVYINSSVIAGVLSVRGTRL